MGHHQAEALPGHLTDDLSRSPDALLRVEILQQLGELGVAPARHGQNEFQRLSTDTDLLQFVEIVQGQ